LGGVQTLSGLFLVKGGGMGGTFHGEIGLGGREFS